MFEYTDFHTTLIIWGAVGYLIGSIPGGVLMARAMGLGNLRDIGSGNIGATNVLRTGNKKAALLTLIIDGGKGAIAVLIARALAGDSAAQAAGFMALVGHCFPVWLGFRGGKGVATYFGVLFASFWPIGLIAAFIWLTIAAVTRYSSMAALVTAGWVPLVVILLMGGKIFFLTAAMCLIIFLRHLGNVKRLRAGTESKIGAK